MATKKTTKTHRRKSDQTQTSVSLSEKALELGKQMAAEDDRSFSKFVERLLIEAAKNAGKLSLIAFVSLHCLRTPLDWSMKALKSSAKAGVAMVKAL